ncbi:MAG: hypothetical protein ACM3NQ_20390 [Bacteroidales bacterium]
MKTSIAVIALASLLAPAGLDLGIDLTKATQEEFQRYVKTVEATVDARTGGKRRFLWVDESAVRLQRVKDRGEVVIERTLGKGPQGITDGLVHDWIGTVFIKGVTLDQTLAMVQDYGRHKTIYPEVMDSKIISREGDHFVIFLRFMKKKAMVTAVLDTEHDAEYFRLDANRVYSRSRTIRIQEVKNMGTPDERKLPPGSDSGFMWALDSYWRFAARDGGVYVECQAVSLSRSIPFWARAITIGLIGPIVNDLPRESLLGTLTATRDAVQKAAAAATPSTRAATK